MSALNPDPTSTPNDGAPNGGQSVPYADTKRPEAGDEDLLQTFIGWYRVATAHWQEWRQDAAANYDFRAGHQWAEEDLQILRDQSRPAISFELIGPFVDSVGGLEINNRQETLYAPRQIGSSGKSDLLSGAAQWVRQECDAEDEETEAFLDAVTCGVGCLQTRLDYDDDPDGMIKIERVDPLELLPDPSSRKQNFADGKFVLRVKDVPLNAAETLFPDADPYDLHAQWAADTLDSAEDPHNARLAPYYRVDQAAQIDRQQAQVRLVEVEWWEYATAYRVLDPQSGRYVRLDPTRASVYSMRCRALGLKPEMIKDRRKKYWKAICGAVVLKVMAGPEEGGFSYKFITAKRDRNRGTWYGIVGAMRDPQLWLNKWASQTLHIINSNAKGGLIAEADAFDDIDEARDSWAQADSITLVNPGKIDKVQPKQPPAFPTQVAQMMDMAVRMIPQVSGINMELMGQSTSQAPQVAMLETGRKQQGMVVLASLFNAKRRYQKEQGRLLLWMIINFIADGRLIRIGGPENAQYVPLIHQDGTAEYDVIVDDAPTSPNMKDKVFSALMQIFPMLRGMQIPPQFYINALKYAPVPESFVTESQQILSQPPPPNPAMQGQQMLNQARAQTEQARVGVHQAAAQKLAAEAQKTMAEAQAMPQTTALNAQETQARIENLRAQAANSLQDAGVTKDTAEFGFLMQAVDALLKTHGATLNADQQAHDQTMDILQHGMAQHQADQPASEMQPAA